MKNKEFVYVIVDKMKRSEHGVTAVARSNYQAKQIIKGAENQFNVVRVRLLDLDKPNRKQKAKTVI